MFAPSKNDYKKTILLLTYQYRTSKSSYETCGESRQIVIDIELCAQSKLCQLLMMGSMNSAHCIRNVSILEFCNFELNPA